ncbi:MAG: damage-inducible protein DinB [Cytophagia bacterium]|nr:damage-inducible protein DinB [Cytophagia bacterium]NBW35317.1 damage-inducible protein DinB [Cytophagia bacterium]
MNTTVSNPVITSEDLLLHWQGHRGLTRRMIEKFPEKEFFTFNVGGMRTCAVLMQELIAIAVPGLRQIVMNTTEPLKEDLQFTSKAQFLTRWDEDTEEINRLWALLPDEKFQERIKTFGQYESTIWWSIFYSIDNEIHHRAQAYVYLRALGIEPPHFWER